MSASAKIGLVGFFDILGYQNLLYRLAAAKKIPAFKVGGTWRFPRADIDQWIKRQTAETLGDDGSDVPGGKD